MNAAAVVVALLSLAASPAALSQSHPHPHRHSPYAADTQRDIKALSPDEVTGYLEGKGMGLARAAELNGYPGPMHVLELAEQLELTPEQRSRTQALFERMRAAAVEAGRALVNEERALDELFSSKSATPEKLADALARIGQRQAEVRRVHLEAHLAQAGILDRVQMGRYDALRGYGATPSVPRPASHSKH